MNNEILNTYPRVTPEAGAYLATNVYIANNRAVFNDDWTINLEASHHYLYWDSNFRARSYAEKGISFEQRCSQIVRECQNKNIKHMSDDILAICTHFNNGYPFGNWYETIASLRFIKDNNLKILANKSQHPGVTEIELHFELAGFSDDRVIYYDKNHVVPFVNKIYCPKIERYIGATSSQKRELSEIQKQWRNDRFEWIQTRYLNHHRVKPILDHIPRKLYLSRNLLNSKNASYNRKVLNEESEVIPLLLDNGFTILTGTESLLTIINYFHSAVEIIFPHGSMIHNAIFCKSKPKIVEFMSIHRQRDHFYLLFNDVASNYDMIICDADSQENNNIIIDINKLKEIL